MDMIKHLMKPNGEPLRLLLLLSLLLAAVSFGVRCNQLGLSDDDSVADPMTARMPNTHFLEYSPDVNRGAWRLHLHFTQASIAGVLTQANANTPIPAARRDALLREYMAGAVRIYALDGDRIMAQAQLVPREILPGGPEPIFVYDLLGLPAHVEMLRVRITAGRENAAHTNYLYMVRADGQQNRYVLNERNDFSVRVRAAGISRYAVIVWLFVGTGGIFAHGALLWFRLRSIQRRLLSIVARK